MHSVRVAKLNSCIGPSVTAHNDTQDGMFAAMVQWTCFHNCVAALENTLRI